MDRDMVAVVEVVVVVTGTTGCQYQSLGKTSLGSCGLTRCPLRTDLDILNHVYDLDTNPPITTYRSRGR